MYERGRGLNLVGRMHCECWEHCSYGRWCFVVRLLLGRLAPPGLERVCIVQELDFGRGGQAQVVVDADIAGTAGARR